MKAAKRKNKKKKVTKQVIGWREWLALPDLGVDAIKAKIDTGARTSALHAFGVKTFERDGERWLRFNLHPFQRDARSTLSAEALLLEERWIRSSNGERSLRPVILTTVRLGIAAWETEVTLVRRDMMGFRMLLGRQSIRRHYLVDPGRSFLWGKRDLAAAGRAAPAAHEVNR